MACPKLDAALQMACVREASQARRSCFEAASKVNYRLCPNNKVGHQAAMPETLWRALGRRGRAQREARRFWSLSAVAPHNPRSEAERCQWHKVHEDFMLDSGSVKPSQPSSLLMRLAFSVGELSAGAAWRQQRARRALKCAAIGQP